MTSDDSPTKSLLLDKGAAAQRLGVPESAIENLHRTRQLRGVQIGKSLFWRPSDLVKFVDELEPEK